ncbi:MAG TPA: thioether cross-link-forming SCIFF peptide maturase [Bacillota bacterium]|nr:thioether cross-link-forming SCIFF peptide maturase [Bacillota bacterium]
MIHKFVLDGAHIVVDVNSGTVHVTDKIGWQLLDLVGDSEALAEHETCPGHIQTALAEAYHSSEVEEAWQELRQLVLEGRLFTPDTPFSELHRASEPVVKSLCLHIAHDCNLRCRYCFAGTGQFGGDRELMSEETGRAALDFILESSGARKNCEVDFFGGEPLMNFGVVQRLVEYGRVRAAEKGKVIKFTLTTNGVLLDEKVAQWLNEQEIAVVLSLDGRPEVNDRMRPFVSGQGCYDRIVPRLQSFVESRQNQNYYVRGTFTAHNLDFSQDVQHLADLGFQQISVEPVVAPETEDYALKLADVPMLEAEYEQLTRKYLEYQQQGRPFNFFHFNLDLSGGPCIAKRIAGCGAGHEYMAVSPKGELFPCHQFVGRPEFSLGNVFERNLKVATMEQFRHAHIYNKPTCGGCWAKFFCSGGCHANAYAANGSLLEPQEIGCRLEKKRLECAIYLQVKQAGLV